MTPYSRLLLNISYDHKSATEMTAKMHLFLKIKSTKVRSRKWFWSIKTWSVEICVLWSIEIVIWIVKIIVFWNIWFNGWSSPKIRIVIFVVIIVMIVIWALSCRRPIIGRILVICVSLRTHTSVTGAILVSMAVTIWSTFSTFVRVANLLLSSSTSENSFNKIWKKIQKV